jgi:hypothetical protein
LPALRGKCAAAQRDHRRRSRRRNRVQG